MKNLLISEVAEILRHNKNTVWQWVRSGRLEAYKVGGYWLIPEEAVKRLLEEGRTRRGKANQTAFKPKPR